MGMKTIYLKREVEEQLRKEGNMSGLINELLEKHFGNRIIAPSKDVLSKEIAELEKKKDELLVKVEEKEKAEELEQGKIADEKAALERKEKAYENSAERWLKLKEMNYETFEKLWDVSNHERTARFNEFFMELKKGEVGSLTEFCEKRGIKKKLRRNGET